MSGYCPQKNNVFQKCERHPGCCAVWGRKLTLFSQFQKNLQSWRYRKIPHQHIVKLLQLSFFLSIFLSLISILTCHFLKVEHKSAFSVSSVVGFSLSSNNQSCDKHTILFPAAICRTTYLLERLPFSCLKCVWCPGDLNNSSKTTPALSAIFESVFSFSQAGSSSSSSWPFTVLIQADVHTKIHPHGLSVNI